MHTDARRTRHKMWWRVAGSLLVLAGIVAIVAGLLSQQSAPQPSESAATSVVVTPATIPSKAQTGEPTGEPTASSRAPSSSTVVRSSPMVTQQKTSPERKTAVRTSTAVTGPILDRSAPVHLTIPAIKVSSNLEDIGLEPNGEITTPPLEKDSHAYWLNVSPTPGQLGPSVILGHVDSAAWGPAVFFDLGKLRQRDTIEVTLANRTVAIFKVTHVNEYKKATFPTEAVYGNTDHAALRLMTCGGEFDSSARSYESNIVVYADLVTSRSAA